MTPGQAKAGAGQMQGKQTKAKSGQGRAKQGRAGRDRNSIRLYCFLFKLRMTSMYLGLPSGWALPLPPLPLPLCRLSDLLQKPVRLTDWRLSPCRSSFKLQLSHSTASSQSRRVSLEYWQRAANQPSPRLSKHQHARWACHAPVGITVKWYMIFGQKEHNTN